MWEEYLMWMYERNAKKNKLSPECLRMIAVLYQTVDWVSFYFFKSVHSANTVNECERNALEYISSCGYRYNFANSIRCFRHGRAQMENLTVADIFKKCIFNKKHFDHSSKDQHQLKT